METQLDEVVAHPARPLDTSRLSSVRKLLIQELGEWCSICQAHYGFAIEHDPLTGLGRGYL